MGGGQGREGPGQRRQPSAAVLGSQLEGRSVVALPTFDCETARMCFPDKGNRTKANNTSKDLGSFPEL